VIARTEVQADVTTETTDPPERPPGDVAGPAGGIRASATRIVLHLRTLARLEQELARAEMARKGKTAGAGAGSAAAAGALLPYAIGFVLAAIAAALALVVDVWLALLIVGIGLMVIVAILALVSRSLFRRATPLTPTQAIDEARRTRQVLRGGRVG